MEKYKKIKVIGRGAFGTVYLYHRISDGFRLIIKEIPVEQMSKDERHAALNESKVLSMLDHPNIIAYHENFLQDKMMLIVMEYAEGGTLYEFLEERNGKPLTEKEVLRYFSQLVLALQYVHSRLVLHRDLKSQNILLNKDKTILKIGDFGISKILASKSRAITVVGTPYYISPELCEGKPYNQKSDIWALGCILYELLTLRRPFDSDNLPALVMKIMRGSFTPVPDQYSRNLKQLVMNMLHLDPNKRPNTNQIMAQPFMVETLYQMYMTIGCLPPVVRPAELTTSQLNGNAVEALDSASVSDSVASSHSPLGQGKCEVIYFRCDFSCPSVLPLPSDNCVVRLVSFSDQQIVGIDETGHVLRWKEISENENEFVVAADDFLSDITSVVCGDEFAVCLSESGVVSTFGKGDTKDSISSTVEPKILEALFGYNVAYIACGSRHVLAVSEDNDLFAWGFGNKGCLGLGKAEFHALPQIVEIASKPKIKKVFCGTDCSFAVTEDKVLLACGSNRHNKLAMDTEEGLHIEEARVFCSVRSDPLPHSRVELVAAGLAHTAILTEEGIVYTTGSNRYGQLGWGEKTLTHTMPGMVTSLASHKVTNIASGDLFTLALTEDGSLFAWGRYPAVFGKSESGSVTRINSLPCLKDKKVMGMACNSGNCLIVTH